MVERAGVCTLTCSIPGAQAPPSSSATVHRLMANCARQHSGDQAEKEIPAEPPTEVVARLDRIAVAIEHFVDSPARASSCGSAHSPSARNHATAANARNRRR